MKVHIKPYPQSPFHRHSLYRPLEEVGGCVLCLARGIPSGLPICPPVRNYILHSPCWNSTVTVEISPTAGLFLLLFNCGLYHTVCLVNTHIFVQFLVGLLFGRVLFLCFFLEYCEFLCNFFLKATMLLCMQS